MPSILGIGHKQIFQKILKERKKLLSMIPTRVNLFLLRQRVEHGTLGSKRVRNTDGQVSETMK